MSAEIKQLLKMNVDTVVIRKFEVFDRNGATTWDLTSASFSLRRRADEIEVVNGIATINNVDQDRAGNTIKTVAMLIDLRATDVEIGSYYLIVSTIINTQQTDIFRFPVEIIDYRTKGVH